ncbi:MAG: hypothetical protein RL662_2190 [Bacteroidota bacterium]|jgi:multisubunit Na+/H+ antiporter MnhC subunit
MKNKYIISLVLFLAFVYSIFDIFIDIPSIVNKIIGIGSIPFAMYYFLFYFGGSKKVQELKEDIKEKAKTSFKEKAKTN